MFKVSDLLISKGSFIILIKAVTKQLQVFLSRILKFGRLAYISVPLYTSNVDRVYDIVPIKRLRKKTELPKEIQEMSYAPKRLKDNKGHQ